MEFKLKISSTLDRAWQKQARSSVELILNFNSSWVLLALAFFGLLLRLLALACCLTQFSLLDRVEKLTGVRYKKTQKNAEKRRKTQENTEKRRKTLKNKEILKKVTLWRHLGRALGTFWSLLGTLGPLLGGCLGYPPP